jgi:hypothetical protein
LSQPLLQRIVLVGRYLIVIKDDTSSSHLFALARGHGAGTASGAPSTARRGATAATCRTAAYRDASMAVTTSDAARTTGPGDDHAARLVTPLHWSDVDVVRCGHYRQQRCPHHLVHAEGSQPAAGIMSSAEGWSVVSAFKLAASRVSPRLDPGLRSAA